MDLLIQRLSSKRENDDVPLTHYESATLDAMIAAFQNEAPARPPNRMEPITATEQYQNDEEASDEMAGYGGA